MDCSPRYHAVPQNSEGSWPGRCCAPCVAQHLDTSHSNQWLQLHIVFILKEKHTHFRSYLPRAHENVFEFNLLKPPHASLHNTTATAPQSIWIRHCIIHQWKWPASSVRLLPAALLPASPRQLLLVAPFIACSK